MSRTYLEEIGRLREQVERLFEQVTRTSSFGSESAAGGQLQPPADVQETAEAYLIWIELPGFDKKSIDLRAVERRLQVSGSRDAAEGGTFHRMEGRYGSFRRSFDFEREIDVEAIEATFERGVLKIEVPKRRAARRRTVAVEEA